MTDRPPPRPIRVTLIQHSTRNDNLGVGALTVAEVEILREVARGIGREIAITIAEWKGVREPCVSGPDITLVGLDRHFLVLPSGYFALTKASDLIIDIGAGDSFADIYGVSRLRRMVLGQHHHVSPQYLHQYANQAAWLEDNRRTDNGTLAHILVSNSMGSPVSRRWKGYWQRAA